MRIILPFVCLVSLLFPAVARGQSFLLHGSGGATVHDPGVSVAAGAGFSPNPHLVLQVDVERTHLFSQARDDGRGGFTGFRGGTLTLVSPQLRVLMRAPDRIGPYGLIGFAAGISQPNVNEPFQDPVTNQARALFFGGGVNVPLRQSISVIADVRMMIGAEAGELLAVAPVRAGIAWRF